MVKYYLRSGLSSIRTHTTRKSSRHTPRHELFMQLTSLEIETCRRMTERAATIKRVESIDARLAAIEAEQSAIQNLLGINASDGQAAVDKPRDKTVNQNRTQNDGVFNY